MLTPGRRDSVPDNVWCFGARSRRVFFYTLLFDMIALTMLFLMVCVLATDKLNLVSVLKLEIVEYSFRTSMFDILLLSCTRAVCMFLFYILLSCDSLVVVALSVIATVCLSVSKIICYHYPEDYNPTPKIFVYIFFFLNFIVSASELWYFDFKVRPRELAFPVTDPDERSRLLNTRDQHISRYLDDTARQEEILSEDEDFRSIITDAAYVTQRMKAAEMEQLADFLFPLVETNDGWKHESGRNLHKGMVYSRKMEVWGQTYKLVATLPASAALAYKILCIDLGDWPRWNTEVAQSRILESVAPNVDIIYQVSAPAMKGIVESREFVNMRVHGSRGNYEFYSFSQMASHPDVPVTSRLVRGENGPCAYHLRQSDEDEDTCIMSQIVNVNLRGKLSTSITNKALSNSMSKTLEALRKHLVKQPHLITIPSGVATPEEEFVEASTGSEINAKS